MRSWPQFVLCSFLSVTITLSPFFDTLALLRRAWVRTGPGRRGKA